MRRVLPLLAVGITAGLIGAAYLGALHLLQRWLWPEHNSLAVQSLLLVGVGLIIAATTRWLGPGSNVELLVDNIHVLGGAETDKGDRALVPLSLLVSRSAPLWALKHRSCRRAEQWVPRWHAASDSTSPM